MNHTTKTHKGFTLIEVLIVSLVMSLFLAGIYSVFFSGQRVAGRAAWNQDVASELRITCEVISRAITATSYPTTILSTAIFDAGGTDTTPLEDISSNYYVNIPSGPGYFTAADFLVEGNEIVMQLCSSSPETSESSGKITWTTIKVVESRQSSEQGTLIIEERTASYTTTAPSYAEELTLLPTSEELFLVRSRQLLNNLEAIEIEATAGHQPRKISLTFYSAYPRDRRLKRSSSMTAVPNTGIRFGSD